jgi:hypothetical protein
MRAKGNCIERHREKHAVIILCTHYAGRVVYMYLVITNEVQSLNQNECKQRRMSMY